MWEGSVLCVFVKHIWISILIFFFPTDFLFDLEGIIMMIKAGIIDLWELNEIIYNIYKYILFATLTYEYILISSERI